MIPMCPPATRKSSLSTLLTFAIIGSDWHARRNVVALRDHGQQVGVDAANVDSFSTDNKLSAH